ncbi:MAG: hypothetical protein U0269_22745 [Polyangiales bacterium]
MTVKRSVLSGVLISGVVLLSAGVAAAQDGGGPPGRMIAPRPLPPPPSFDSNLQAGEAVVARWDLARDASNAQYVMAQTTNAQGNQQCVIAALVGRAWVVDRTDLAADTETPALCFTAARVANRWVFAKWSLGGSGDGARRTNDSAVEFVSIVNGRFARVYQGAVDAFSYVSGGAALSFTGQRNRPVMLTWAADGNTLAAPSRSPRRR